MKQYKVYEFGQRVIVTAGIALLTASAYGQAPAAPVGASTSPAAQAATTSPANAEAGSAPSIAPSKVVLKVGDQEVTAGDLDFLVRGLNPQEQRAVQAQGKQALGNQYAVTLVLEEQALRDHLDLPAEARRQEALEHTQRLAQAEYQKMASETAISETEMSKYFSDHTREFEQVEVREIGIRTRPATAKEGDPGLTAAEAKSRAEEIRKALAAAGADPKKIAKDFTVNNVVYVDPNTRSFQRGQLPPEIEAKLFAGKDGEITDPFDTKQSIVAFQIIKQAHAPEIKDVHANVENILKQQKLQTAVEALKSKATVWLDPDYFKTAAPPAPQGLAQPSPNPGAASASKQ